MITPEQRKWRQRLYRAANRDRINAKKREWRLANLEHVRAKQRAYNKKWWTKHGKDYMRAYREAKKAA